MHATQVASPFHRDGWVYEEKVDGYRMAALKTRESVNLISRNGIHHAKRFSELVKAIDALPAEAFILDGEVAVYDQAPPSSRAGWRSAPQPS